METAASPTDTRCSLHADREAVGACVRCARPTCLDCAVPVRGEILCAECAADEIGAPSVPPVVRPLPAPRWVAAVLVLGLLATVPPWHAFGILTGVLTAWGWEAGPWPPLACASLALAAAASLLSRRATGRIPGRVVWGTLAAVGAGCTGLTLLTAPAFVTASPAPFVALAAASVAASRSLLRPR